MGRYEATVRPDAKDKTTAQIHTDIDGITSDGFNGITAKNGVVIAVVGSLTDSDISEIETYLGVSISEMQL